MLQVMRHFIFNVDNLSKGIESTRSVITIHQRVAQWEKYLKQLIKLCKKRAKIDDPDLTDHSYCRKSLSCFK